MPAFSGLQHILQLSEPGKSEQQEQQRQEQNGFIFHCCILPYALILQLHLVKIICHQDNPNHVPKRLLKTN